MCTCAAPPSTIARLPRAAEARGPRPPDAVTAGTTEAGAYRPDIDGLRAVAVLAVIVFHIDPRWLPGGFVGVDVFFVISGFLITGIVAREVEQGRFSFARFYERRIRRILPALWALLAVCVPVSWLLMLPADAEAMGKSALWSALAMANVHFWRDVATDYFAPQSAQMPLLHLWSLGVEEQYYVLWPLAMLALWRIASPRPRLTAAVAAAVVVLASTLIAEWLLARGGERFAYYMLPTRAGELALGAALALVWPAVRLPPQRARRLGAVAALAGFALLAASLVWLSEHEPFPGWRALLPTMAAALLIAAGGLAPRLPLLAPLRQPVSVWLGRCSYSAYLWHWPVLAWWRYLFGEPDVVAGLALLTVILVLADVSQRWIEAPARRSPARPGRTVVRHLLVPAVLIGSVSLVIARGERWGLPLYPAAQQQAWGSLAQDVLPAHRVDWVCQRHVLDAATLGDPRCEFGASAGRAQVLILGDSHAAQFAPLLRHAAAQQGLRVRSVAIGSCAALPGPLAGVVAPARVQACEDGMRRVLARATDFPLLVIGGAWATYAASDARVWERLERHLRDIVARGHRVWLLPQVPQVDAYDASYPAKRVRVPWLQCPTTRPRKAMQIDTDERLAALASRLDGVHFLDLGPSQCSSTHCDVSDADGRYVYADGSHLSLHGASLLAIRLETAGRLPDLRAMCGSAC